MTDDDLVRLATRYFTALDTRDSDALADTLAGSCLLIIETHNIIHDGKQAICALFESRWTVLSDRMVKARHRDVIHSPSQSSGRITSHQPPVSQAYAEWLTVRDVHWDIGAIEHLIRLPGYENSCYSGCWQLLQNPNHSSVSTQGHFHQLQRTKS